MGLLFFLLLSGGIDAETIHGEEKVFSEELSSIPSDASNVHQTESFQMNLGTLPESTLNLKIHPMMMREASVANRAVYLGAKRAKTYVYRVQFCSKEGGNCEIKVSQVSDKPESLGIRDDCLTMTYIVDAADDPGPIQLHRLGAVDFVFAHVSYSDSVEHNRFKFYGYDHKEKGVGVKTRHRLGKNIPVRTKNDSVILDLPTHQRVGASSERLTWGDIRERYFCLSDSDNEQSRPLFSSNKEHEFGYYYYYHIGRDQYTMTEQGGYRENYVEKRLQYYPSAPSKSLLNKKFQGSPSYNRFPER